MCLEKLHDFCRTHALALWFACYGGGVIVAAWTPAAPWVVSALVVASVVAGCALRTSGRRTLAAMLGCFVAGDLSAAAAIAHIEHPSYAALGGHHVVVDAVALERPRVVERASVRVRILVVREPQTAGQAGLAGVVALVSYPADRHVDLAGRHITVRGRLDLPGGPRNEGEPGEREQLADRGVQVTIAAHRSSDVRAFGDAAGWEAGWARARSRLADAVESRLPPLEATVLEGILWGDRGNLPATLRQEFSDTGTVHVLTTAGLHLGIMAALVLWLTGLAPLGRPWRAAIVVVAAWAYAALAGMHLPTVRAATMLTAGAAALESGRGRTPSAVLASAAFAVTLPHPLVLLSPSFSMSFACVAGIALVSPILSALGLDERCGLPRLFVEVLRTSFAVQVALWPLQALYFGAFTPYAVIANAVVVPLVGAIMAAGSAFCAATIVLPMLAAPLGNIAWWGLATVIAAVQYFAGLPAAHMDMPPPSHLFLVAYWSALGGLWLALRAGMPGRRLLFGAVSAAAILALLYCLPGIAAATDRHLRLDAIDVGQADCLLVRAPGGHAMLVDGGGRLERTTSGQVVAAPIGDRIAAETVMPFLLRHWVLHLDAIVLTHPHGDHAGGLPVILSRERTGAVYDSAQLYSGPAYHRMLAVMRERHIRWLRAERGVSFDLGPQTRVAVLAPELPLIAGTSSDINNNSVVLHVTFGRVAMLLTGDAQSEAEARLLSHGGADLRADILKVGHHGSAYSSTPAFLFAVHPTIAIISCGLHNVFGHPSPQTLTALQVDGARIYRTDLDGGVSIISDGKTIQARSVSSAPF